MKSTVVKYEIHCNLKAATFYVKHLKLALLVCMHGSSGCYFLDPLQFKRLLYNVNSFQASAVYMHSKTICGCFVLLL